MLDPLINAVSWRIASQLVVAAPQLRVYETHPEGGGDCLLVQGPGVEIEIDRNGLIRGTGKDREVTVDWLPMAKEGSTDAIIQEIVTGVRMPIGSVSTPHSLTYKVIARLTSARALELPRWDVRSQFFGDLDEGGKIIEPVPSAEMTSLPANELWRVLRGKKVVAWLWDGWVWNNSGERRDLVAAYSRYATIDSLVAIVTEAAAKARAARLPRVRDLPAQPTGT